MKNLVNRWQTDPYPDGTRLEHKTTGKPGTLLRQCPCTDPLLHYEVKMDGEPKEFIYLHDQIAEVFTVL